MNTKTTMTINETLGGETGVRTRVQRFYALMDKLPKACAVRRMHLESIKGSAHAMRKQPMSLAQTVHRAQQLLATEAFSCC